MAIFYLYSYSFTCQWTILDKIIIELPFYSKIFLNNVAIQWNTKIVISIYTTNLVKQLAIENIVYIQTFHKPVSTPMFSNSLDTREQSWKFHQDYLMYI